MSTHTGWIHTILILVTCYITYKVDGFWFVLVDNTSRLLVSQDVCSCDTYVHFLTYVIVFKFRSKIASVVMSDTVGVGTSVC